MSAAGAVFPQFERFNAGVIIVNSISSDKFQLVLSKTLRAVGEEPTLPPFNDSEVTQLAGVLGLANDSDAHALVQLTAYIFERAALFGLKAPQLLVALVEGGLSEAQSSSYAAVWAADAPAFTTKLRTRSSTLGVPWALQDVSWELSLGIGSSGATSVKETSTTLEFTLGKEGGRGSDDDIKRVPVAFTRQQLLAFLEKLDTVQQQVDALSS